MSEWLLIWWHLENNVKRSLKLSTTFWISPSSSNTRLVFSLSLFISVSFSDAQISNLYLLEPSEVGWGEVGWDGVGNTTLKNSAATYKRHLKLIVHGGVEGGKYFLYKWNVLSSPSTLYQQHHQRKTIFHTEGAIKYCRFDWKKKKIEKGQPLDADDQNRWGLRTNAITYLAWKPRQRKHSLKVINKSMDLAALVKTALLTLWIWTGFGFFCLFVFWINVKSIIWLKRADNFMTEDDLF